MGVSHNPLQSSKK